jgi:hypothetical protein
MAVLITVACAAGDIGGTLFMQGTAVCQELEGINRKKGKGNLGQTGSEPFDHQRI